ncbi:MAG: HEAT repeat domain-containing protein [Mycobacterium kyogaense]|uniref:HEAT repeat domain-containing protein n=1 Tax=Mycobacterium kyogaense TaxID=2212479 RepID=UPI002FF6684A
MNEPRRPSNDDRISQLRQAIGAIESTSADMVRRPRQDSDATSPTAQSNAGRQAFPVITYPDMPEGDDWIHRVPARYHDGERGFDRRIMEDLAAVGVPCYTLSDLQKVRTIPQGIPIFLDWLTHLEARIPGPETRHRAIIRGDLIRNLNDPAAKGNRDVIEALLGQLRHQPPLDSETLDFAVRALTRLASKKDFALIAGLLDELPPAVPKGPLIEYMGKVKTPEAREIALRYLDTEWTYFALKALIAMKAEGVRDRIEPHMKDANSMVRRYARQAMEKLPA